MQCKTSQVLDTVRKTAARHAMLKAGDRVLVGVSGGADSVCLLHVLKTLQKEWKIQLEAVHVHHGIRGDAAERDVDFVRGLCKQWEIPFTLERVSAPEIAEAEKVSLETAGRLARYRCFHEICERRECGKIATAHNQNDQAETILMRVLRGAGIDGLAGIRYVRADGVIRPLLDVTRAEIEAYCRENNLNYCTDGTNLENDYTRNKIRNKLLPLLQEEFNENILGALVNLSRNMEEDGTFLNDYAERLYRRINSPLPKKQPVVLDIESLKMVAPSIRTRLLQLAVRDAMGRDYRAERQHWESVCDLLEKETGAQVMLPKGLCVAVRYGWLVFETPKERQERTEFSDAVWETAELGKTYHFPNGDVTLSLKETGQILLPNQMLADYDKLEGLALELRTRRKGDRIAVYADGRSRKLKDFMIDYKIPRWERDSIPLLCSGNRVIAVIGCRVAEPYKADKNTKRGMVITYGTADESRRDYADGGTD